MTRNILNIIQLGLSETLILKIRVWEQELKLKLNMYAFGSKQEVVEEGCSVLTAKVSLL